MITFKEILAMVLLGSGFFFLAVGAIGLIRMPDVYNRMHALGKCDTLGNWLTVLGLILIIGDPGSMAKMALIIVLVALITPVMTHLIAKTALTKGIGLVEGSFHLDTYTERDQGIGERGDQEG